MSFLTSRRRLWPAALLCGALSLLTSSLAQSSRPAVAATRPPNIIFIYADDLGHGDLGSYGKTVAQMFHSSKSIAYYLP